MEQEEGARLLAELEAEQARLRDLVAGKETALLAAKPRRVSHGTWSVLEQLQHLLFAEQLHLGRFVPGGIAWHPFGAPPDGMRRQARFSMLGQTPPTSAQEVLAAWAEIHDATRPFVAEGGAPVLKALEGNLRHLRNHVRVIERLLRQPRRR